MFLPLVQKLKTVWHYYKTYYNLHISNLIVYSQEAHELIFRQEELFFFLIIILPHDSLSCRISITYTEVHCNVTTMLQGMNKFARLHL